MFPNGLPSNVTAVLAGHMHRFQAIGFGDRRPPQLIVGTAGIILSHVQPVPPSPDDKQPILVPKLDGIDAGGGGPDGPWRHDAGAGQGRRLDGRDGLGDRQDPGDLRFELAAQEPQPVSMPIAVTSR